MIPRLFALLLPAALVGCASGSTIRATDGEDTGASGPVSLAPAPSEESQADPGSVQEPAPEATAPSQPPAQPQSDAQPSQGYAPYASTRSIDIRRLGQWTRTGIAESRRLVIRDANAWSQFWSELGVGERPQVDFTRDVVVAVAAGQRSTGGFEIAVDRITQTDGELSVEVVERTPGPNCMTTASLTQPVDVVVVPAADARSWSFMERKEIRGCR
ncbi:MAG TPA: protease complex subunit PrcB family protein [Gemmatimonadales bacterium]|nr:protease complex subunit PrcB family protein [Gemmatimonadales bacterium]